MRFSVSVPASPPAGAPAGLRVVVTGTKEANLVALSRLRFQGKRRRTSRKPPTKPSPPRISIKIQWVCNQRSRKKPSAPPSTVAPTMVNGNSKASSAGVKTFLAFATCGDVGCGAFGLSSRVIARHYFSNSNSPARCVAFTTALISVTRSLPSSSSRMPSMVQPAGVVTASLSSAG